MNVRLFSVIGEMTEGNSFNVERKKFRFYILRILPDDGPTWPKHVLFVLAYFVMLLVFIVGYVRFYTISPFLVLTHRAFLLF
jgi:hypothetical protein